MKNKKILYPLICLIVIVTGIYIFNSRKITYTKEFTYLPQYKNMVVNKHQLPKNNQFGSAVYKVKDADYNGFLNKYESILKRDGWEITKNNKPEHLEAKKSNHIVKINAVNSKEYINVLIWTK